MEEIKKLTLPLTSVNSIAVGLSSVSTSASIKLNTLSFVEVITS